MPSSSVLRVRQREIQTMVDYTTTCYPTLGITSRDATIILLLLLFEFFSTLLPCTLSTPWIAESIPVNDIKYLVPNTYFSISITDMQNGSCHGPRETKIPHNNSHNTTTTTSGAIILSGGVAAASSATATAAVAAANGSVTVRYLPLQCCTDWDCSSSNTLEDVWQSSPPLVFYCIN